MAEVTIAGGTLEAAEDDRSFRGLLVPYGVECSSNLGRFTVSRGTLAIPRDVPNTVGITDAHVRESPIGRATLLAESDAGITGVFRFADTPEGDAAIADVRSGRRRFLSVEAADVMIRAGQAVSGRIFGASLVERPAFPGATLMAAAADTPAPAEQHTSTTTALPDGSEQTVTEDTTEESEQLPDGTTRVTKTVTTVTETTPPADGQAQEGNPVSSTPPAAPATTLQAAEAARVPSTLVTGGRPPAEPEAVNLSTLYGMLADATRTQDRTLLAALSDVAITGAGAPGANIQQPQWLGELWQSREYQRRYVPLLGHGDLTSFRLQGWRWTTKPAMGPWAGNKSNVPSGPIATEPYEVQAKRWAGAHDIAREYRDFSVPEFWDGYFRAMTESYAKLTDADTLATLLVPANSTAVTRGAVPAGVSPVVARIIDGALAIIDEGAPAWALLSTADYRSVLLTPKDQVLEYLNSALGLEEGSVAGFRIIPTSALPNGSTLVGSPNAATVHELSQTPIRVEGLDMVKGGIDPGLFGYSATVIHNPAALALVTEPGA